MKEELNLTLLDIAKVCSWNDVAKALTYCYGKKWLRLKPVFEHIQIIRKRKPKDSQEYLQVSIGGFVNLDKEEVENRFYTIHTNKYSLSFRSWGELANIPFDEDTLRHYKFPELLAHFLYEITWYGNEKEMMKKKKDIFSRLSKPKK